MKSFAKICLVLVTAVTLAAFTAHAQTDSSSPSTNTPPAAAKPRPKPYHGVIASVDNDAKTFTVTLTSGASQTIHIGSRTRIKKDGEPATVVDIVAGQNVRGAARKSESGNWIATSVYLGLPKPKAAAPPAVTTPPSDATK